MNNDRKESEVNGEYSKEKETDGQSSLTVSEEQTDTERACCL